jgi:hypothetical protein
LRANEARDRWKKQEKSGMLVIFFSEQTLLTHGGSRFAYMAEMYKHVATSHEIPFL